ncbi:MAG: BlaI/MecI/CopY family transcriptional regulator [Firmicutes bacterium]|nr:BlaI/MecI/CopY family transcriptional regulator [Bacillota bacterium]
MQMMKLSDSEYRFMQIVWDHAPLGSGKLVELCLQQLGWKKSTTYTTLKKLCDKGYLQNEQAVVSVLISKEQAQTQESDYFVNRTFGGSLPQFLTAFLGEKKLSRSEVLELKKMIEEHEASPDAENPAPETL